MNKIFISHNQDFDSAGSIKGLINILGAYGVLVEHEPGAEPLDEKSFRLLKECQGFLAICTNDLNDGKGNFSPKSNVALEIKEWQGLHKTRNMIIIKEKGCMLPTLLGNPTYCSEFEGVTILEVTYKALSEFQTLGLIPYKDAPVKHSKTELSFTKKEIELLNFLANCQGQKEYAGQLKENFKFTVGEWNAAIHKLCTEASFIESTYDRYRGPVLYKLTKYGFDYLLKKSLFKDLTPK